MSRIELHQGDCLDLMRSLPDGSIEQLSPQEHYDFGMRGLKALLVASGNMKRKYGDKYPEFTLAFSGFLNINLPKFTS